MSNKKRILVACLNQGKLAVELAESLMAMKDTPSYDVEIEFHDDAPISNNRNKIVQRFLAKGYDYLLMIDDDITPPPSVVNMADFGKDVMAATTFIWQQGVVMPVAWNRLPDGMYTPIDITDKDGIIEVDSVGSGCIMLSRKVLEEVKAPFVNEYDPDGIKLFGLDIAFCQKAKEKGFKVYTNLDYICGHWKNVNLRTVFANLNSMKEEIIKLKKQ